MIFRVLKSLKNETIHPQLGELDNKKLLLFFFLRKITQTKLCIEMMWLLLYQINYPPFCCWRVWGLDRVPVQSFSCFAGIFTGLPGKPSHKMGFRSFVSKSGHPGEGKHEGLVGRNDVLTNGFIGFSLA